MKMTADQLLKIAGIAPSTTLRTRLNESAGSRTRRSVKEAADGGAVYISDDGRVRSVPADEVADYTEGAKSKKTPAGTVYRADDYWIIVPTAGGSGAIQIEFDGRTNAMSADEVADYTEGAKSKKTPAGTVYSADEYFVFVPTGSVNEAAGSMDVKAASEILKKAWTGKDNNFHSSSSNGTIKVDYVMDKETATKHANKHVATLKRHGISATPHVTRGERQGTPYFYHGVKLTGSVKEGMESKSDSLEYQFGGLGKAFEEQIYTMVDMMMDDEGFDPNTADVRDILDRVAEVINDIALDITGEPAARRAVTNALGQAAQSYDDEGKMSKQRQFNV